MSRRAAHKNRHSQHPTEDEARKKQARRTQVSTPESETAHSPAFNPLPAQAASQAVSGSKLPSNAHPASQAAMLQAQHTYGNAALQRLMAPNSPTVMRAEKDPPAPKAPAGEKPEKGEAGGGVKDELYAMVKKELAAAGVEEKALVIASKAASLLLAQVKGTTTWKDFMARLNVDKTALQADINTAVIELLSTSAIQGIGAMIAAKKGNSEDLVKGVLSEAAQAALSSLPEISQIVDLGNGLEGKGDVDISGLASKKLKASLSFGYKGGAGGEAEKKVATVNASASLDDGTANINALLAPIQGLNITGGVGFQNGAVSGQASIMMKGRDYNAEILGGITNDGTIRLKIGGEYMVVQRIYLKGNVEYIEGAKGSSVSGSGSARFLATDFLTVGIEGSGRRSTMSVGGLPEGSEAKIMGTLTIPLESKPGKK